MHLKLTNWMCMPAIELDLTNPLTMIVGAHEVGKSAIRDAFCFATTGTLSTRPGVTRKGEIGAMAIGQGAKSAKVELNLVEEEGLLIQRSVTRTGTQGLVVESGMAEPTRGVTDGQAEIYKVLRTDEGRILAAFDAWSFLDMDADRSRGLLVRAMGEQVTREVVLEKLLARHCAPAIVPEVAGIAARSFREAEQHAVVQRQAAHRAVKELGAAQPPEPMLLVADGRPRIDLRQGTLVDAEKRLHTLRGELSLAERSGAEVVASARTMLETQQPRLEEIEVQIEGHKDAAEIPAEIEAARAECERLEGLLEPLEKAISEGHAYLETAKSLSVPKICPALGVKCLATEAAVKREGKKLKDGAPDVQNRVAENTAKKLTIQSDLDGQRQSLEELVASQGTPFDAAGAGAMAEELRGIIAHSEKVIADHAGEEHPGVDLKALKARVAAGEAIVRAKQLFDRDENRFAQNADKIAKATAEHEAWDLIAQSLKPEGVESDLIPGMIAGFLAHANVIAEFVGLGTVGMDAEFRLQVTRDGDGATMRACQLSRSARLRLGIAIQHAFAVTAGLPVLIVDELDVFNAEVQPKVMGALFRASQENYTAVIGLATLKVGAPTRPAHPGVGMFWLRNSRLEQVTS